MLYNINIFGGPNFKKPSNDWKSRLSCGHSCQIKPSLGTSWKTPKTWELLPLPPFGCAKKNPHFQLGKAD